MKILDPLVAIRNKRRFPNLDQLVSDDVLRSTASRSSGDTTWNLFNALADRTPLSEAILFSLDENLGALFAIVAIRAHKALRNRLLNGEQLLNTLSEVALARHLLKSGWEVALDYRFFGKRDVDIWCKKEAVERLVEVVNLALPSHAGVGNRDFEHTFQA